MGMLHKTADEPDYILTLRVRNNRIISIMRKMALTPTQLSEKAKCSIGQIHDILSMKQSPLSKVTGEFRPWIWRIAEVLKTHPENLFNERQLAGMFKNKAELILSEEEVHSYLAAPQHLYPHDFSIERESKEALTHALSTLTPREQNVIERRFGLNGHSVEDLEEIAVSQNVTRERIRQLEIKALTKLRHPKRSQMLLATAPFKPLNYRLDDPNSKLSPKHHQIQIKAI